MPRKKRGRKSSKMVMANGRNRDLARKVAVGATGVALTAGAVAVGAALVDRTLRDKITKSAGRTAIRLSKVAQRFQNSDQGYKERAVLHEVRRREGTRRKGTRGRSRTR